MDKPQRLIIGKILKPFGVRGELKVEILTEFPDRFASLRQVFVGDDAKSFLVERAHLHNDHTALVKLHGIDSPEDAGKFREALLYVAVDDAVKLRENQVYLFQTIGLTVITTDGQTLGKIVDVLDTRANDVYVVREGAREILLPAIPDVVREINLARGEMIVKLIEGLI
jgi:16S rRNA processing protein RimM